MNDSKSEAISDFIAKKTGLLSDGSSYSKAMLAKLRQGIGKRPESYPDVWEIFLVDLDKRFLSSDGILSDEEEVIYTIMTLYALHQQTNEKPMCAGKDSFGAAIAKLLESDGRNENALKRRFDAIITAKDFTELSYHARGMIKQMSRKGIPMDYKRFATDLYFFHCTDAKNRGLLRWGEDYYRNLKVGKAEKEEESNE